MRKLEKWLPVCGYEGRYEVSDLGNVRSLLSGKVLREQVPWTGYRQVSLYGGGRRPRRYSIHRLVLEAFTGPFVPEQQTNHLNGNRADNRLCNLEKVTRLENMHHAAAMGWMRYPRGEAIGRSKLTEVAVAEIKANPDSLNQTELAARYGVHQSSINHILSGKTWRHVA